MPGARRLEMRDATIRICCTREGCLMIPCVKCPPTPRTRSKPSEELNSAGTGSAATYVQQECPVCGRPLLIRVEHLGQRVTCLQCRCAFVCYDPSQTPARGEESGDSLLDRAERLLALVEARARG